MDDLLTTFWLPMVLEGRLKSEDLMEKLSEFNTDFSAYQAEQKPIGRDKPGVHGSSYAGWPQLRGESIELLKKHNLSIMQHFSGTKDNPQFAVYLRHNNGYLERYDCLAVKPSEYMKPQEFGGLNTYMKRYTYTSILGIADPSEEDLDKQEYEKEEDQSAPECPQCKALMKRKTSKQGAPFWGCSAYETTGCKGYRKANE